MGATEAVEGLPLKELPAESVRKLRAFLERCAVSRDVRLRHDGAELLALTNWADLEFLATLVGSKLPRGNDLIYMTAFCAGFPISEILGEAKHQRIVTVRHVAFFLIRRHAQLSFPAIAAMVRRDHSTVQYAVRKIGRLLEEGDPFVVDLCRRVELMADLSRTDGTTAL